MGVTVGYLSVQLLCKNAFALDSWKRPLCGRQRSTRLLSGRQTCVVVSSILWITVHVHKIQAPLPYLFHRLVGLVERRPPREWKIPGSNLDCAGIFPGSSHTSDLKIGTPVATLPGAWRYRVSAGTGWTGVSIHTVTG